MNSISHKSMQHHKWYRPAVIKKKREIMCLTLAYRRAGSVVLLTLSMVCLSVVTEHYTLALTCIYYNLVGYRVGFRH